MTSILAQGIAKALRAISKVLPSHTKRLVLWSMLYSQVNGKDGITSEQCDRLNEALTLCKDKNALTLPVTLGKFIGTELDHCTEVAKQAMDGVKSADIAAYDFIRNIPVWLRYASDALMHKDFMSLLEMDHRPVSA